MDKIGKYIIDNFITTLLGIVIGVLISVVFDLLNIVNDKIKMIYITWSLITIAIIYILIKSVYEYYKSQLEEFKKETNSRLKSMYEFNELYRDFYVQRTNRSNSIFDEGINEVATGAKSVVDQINLKYKEGYIFKLQTTVSDKLKEVSESESKRVNIAFDLYKEKFKDIL